MESNRTLIAAGSIGAIIAALCCATPLLAVLLGAAGPTAWLAEANYVVIPALLICLGLIALGLNRRRVTAQLYCDTDSSKQGVKS